MGTQMQTWGQNTWRGYKRLLTDLPDESLWRGDVFRLPFHPSLGPSSRPVEMLLFELWGYESRLGLVPIAGYNAGAPYCYFPDESQGDSRLSLETKWLHANWSKWLVYEEWCEDKDDIVVKPMPIEGTLVIRKSRPRNLRID
jgi:hypothetical protein